MISSQKTALLPDLPPVATAGVAALGDFQAIGWFGVFVTAKVPADVLSALRTAMRGVMSQTDTKDKLMAMGADPQSGSSDEMRALLRREITTWTKVIQDGNIKAQ